MYNVDAYIILVDRNFLVEKTNYYNLNNTSEGQVLRRVGELLRCKNGLDAGACGSHENCKVCPVRNSIEKCFREKGHFSPLETPMRLYMSEMMDNYVDCIVCVSGTYLQLDQDDKVLLTVRDVTRQKKILDELEEARRNAELAGEQKTAFLANMSHEIRTPLNAIVGFAGLLGTASDQDRISYVEIIKGNTNMLLQLVNDILDMSKIEAGTLEFIYTDVDVNQIMRELEGIFRLRLEEADVPVRIIFEPKLPVCFIHTEKNRISQVISNFLSNAFKYTVQGSITMGSTFWYVLPDKPFDFLPLQSEEKEQFIDLSEPESCLEHKTILIAEDMDDNYLLYKIYLEKKYNLIRAENGEEAISKFLEYSPAVILMDIGMPVVDGYQATEAIRQLSSKVPIVAVTAFAYDEDKRKVMSRGFNGYLSKPLNKEALFDMLRQMGI